MSSGIQTLDAMFIGDFAKRTTRTIGRIITKHRDTFEQWVDANRELVNSVVMGGAVGSGVYWVWARSRNHTIRDMRIEYPDVHFEQIPVKNQFELDGGGAASCGYHAINNGEHIAGWLTGRIRNLLRALFNIDKIQKRFGRRGSWRNKVRHMRTYRSNGDWIHSREIDRLMNRKTGVPRYPYSTIDDVALLGLSVEPVHIDRAHEAMVDDTIPIVKEALREAHQAGRDYIHQFFINTARHLQAGQEGAVAGIDGHWFTVVLHQLADGTRTYYVADSAGYDDRINSDEMFKLVDTIEK